MWFRIINYKIITFLKCSQMIHCQQMTIQILEYSRKLKVGRDGHTFFLSKNRACPNQFYKSLMGVFHWVKQREGTYWKQCLPYALNLFSKLVRCYFCNIAKFRATICSYCGHPWVEREGRVASKKDHLQSSTSSRKTKEMILIQLVCYL